VTWADGHGSIYPFEGLRRACPCGACAGLTTLSAAMAWPGDLRRTPEGLAITWSDGHRGVHAYPALRGLCRCASCTGGH
jgi:DUF971 family protein